MTDACRCTGFAQKAESRRFIAEVSLADDLQSHGAAQIDVERFVSDPHRTATQLDRSPVFARNQLIVVKSLLCFYWCRFERIPIEDPPDSTPPAETLTKHANRQNSIAPENSLPQLGQVRLVSVLIFLDALRRQPQPTATPP